MVGGSAKAGKGKSEESNICFVCDKLALHDVAALR
jgi:hypothetical protein